MLTLQVKKRGHIGKGLGKLRDSGLIPGVLYGSGNVPEAITVAVSDLINAWKEAGESSLLSLSVADSAEPKIVLIRELQRDPVSLQPLHVDFHQVRMDEELEIAVPIEFTGEAPAAKEQAGVLVKDLYEIEIRALPKNLPHEFAVDLSSLANVDDMIQVKDIKFPAGVEVKVSEDTVIAHIAPLISEKELEAAPEMSVEDIEVVGQKKESAEEAVEEEAGE